MKKKLLEILICPVCKNELTLQEGVEKGDEIIEGSLYCERCKESYPIIDGIPHFVSPEKKAEV